MHSETLSPDAHHGLHSTASQAPVARTYCKTLYRQRHKVENMFAKAKDWRRISMRYDRCAHTSSALSASRQPLSFGSVNES